MRHICVRVWESVNWASGSESCGRESPSIYTHVYGTVRRLYASVDPRATGNSGWITFGQLKGTFGRRRANEAYACYNLLGLGSSIAPATHDSDTRGPFPVKRTKLRVKLYPFADSNNCRVQVFNDNDRYLRKFEKKGKKEGEIADYSSIAIDSDIVYTLLIVKSISEIHPSQLLHNWLAPDRPQCYQCMYAFLKISLLERLPI